MSFERRFIGDNDQYRDGPYCEHGPDYCGKCRREHCFYLMHESFMEADG